MFWPRVCCSWALSLHGLSTKTLSQPRGLISPAATLILRPCPWKTKSQRSSAKTTTCRSSRWRINVRTCFNTIFCDVQSTCWHLWRANDEPTCRSTYWCDARANLLKKKMHPMNLLLIQGKKVRSNIISLYCHVISQYTVGCMLYSSDTVLR